MKKEIQFIHINNPDLLGVYGFGSYFRQEMANDCDLLLVISDRCINKGACYAQMYQEFLSLGLKLSILFDITVLTEREHNKAPLREHTRLIEIFVAN